MFEYESFVKTHKISNYEQLLNILTGKCQWKDFREDYIFRGLKNSNYKLIPSSLRKDENTNDFLINNFITESEFKFYLNTNISEVKKIDEYKNEFEDLDDINRGGASGHLWHGDVSGDEQFL